MIRFLYSTVIGLVFAKLYFPKSDPLVGTLQAFLIYAVGFLARPVGAAIFGHRAAATGVFGFLYFALLDTVVPGWIFVAIVLSLIPHDMMYGAQAALIAECFTGRLRYSGSSRVHGVRPPGSHRVADFRSPTRLAPSAGESLRSEGGCGRRRSSRRTAAASPSPRLPEDRVETMIVAAGRAVEAACQ